VDVVPEAWVVEHDGVQCLDQRGDGACVALDAVTHLCTIYATRPRTCREFERGSGLCRDVLERHARRTATRGLQAKSGGSVAQPIHRAGGTGLRAL
jgi:Fe-S-cluster containining protein